MGRLTGQLLIQAWGGLGLRLGLATPCCCQGRPAPLARPSAAWPHCEGFQGAHSRRKRHSNTGRGVLGSGGCYERFIIGARSTGHKRPRPVAPPRARRSRQSCGNSGCQGPPGGVSQGRCSRGKPPAPALSRVCLPCCLPGVALCPGRAPQGGRTETKALMGTESCVDTAMATTQRRRLSRRSSTLSAELCLSRRRRRRRQRRRGPEETGRVRVTRVPRPRSFEVSCSLSTTKVPSTLPPGAELGARTLLLGLPGGHLWRSGHTGTLAPGKLPAQAQPPAPGPPGPRPSPVPLQPALAHTPPSPAGQQ